MDKNKTVLGMMVIKKSFPMTKSSTLTSLPKLVTRSFSITMNVTTHSWVKSMTIPMRPNYTSLKAKMVNIVGLKANGFIFTRGNSQKRLNLYNLMPQAIMTIVQTTNPKMVVMGTKIPSMLPKVAR